MLTSSRPQYKFYWPVGLSAISARTNDRKLGTSQSHGSSTPASRLLKFLHESPDLAYVALTAEFDEGSRHITIRKSTRKSDGAPPTVEVVSDLVAVDEEGVKDSANRHASSILKALSLGAGERVLLCCAWVTKKALRHFQMHPHAVGMDVTNGTNSEKRPQFRATCLASNNTHVPFFNAFLPSGASWVFRWLFATAFPALIPLETLRQVSVVKAVNMKPAWRCVNE